MIEECFASVCITISYLLLGYPTLTDTCSNQMNNQNPL